MFPCMFFSCAQTDVILYCKSVDGGILNPGVHFEHICMKLSRANICPALLQYLTVNVIRSCALLRTSPAKAHRGGKVQLHVFLS
jgi:hypothetical protein